jgi:Na+-transporting methylmalonyl-CoA/oxaloacetate decarboxylase gamma subunit
MDILSSSTGFLVIIVLPMLLFFIYQVYHLIMVSIHLKKAIQAEEAAKKNQEQDDIEAKRAEAEAALAEAKRLKAEAEAQLTQMENATKEEDE